MNYTTGAETGGKSAQLNEPFPLLPLRLLSELSIGDRAAVLHVVLNGPLTREALYEPDTERATLLLMGGLFDRFPSGSRIGDALRRNPSPCWDLCEWAAHVRQSELRFLNPSAPITSKSLPANNFRRAGRRRRATA